MTEFRVGDAARAIAMKHRVAAHAVGGADSMMIFRKGSRFLLRAVPVPEILVAAAIECDAALSREAMSRSSVSTWRGLRTDWPVTASAISLSLDT